MKTTRALAAALALGLGVLVAASGCTFEDGDGWATLDVEAVVPMLGDERQLHSGEAVHVQRLSVRIESVALIGPDGDHEAPAAVLAPDCLVGGDVAISCGALPLGRVEVAEVAVHVSEFVITAQLESGEGVLPLHVRLAEGEELELVAATPFVVGPGSAADPALHLSFGIAADLFAAIDAETLPREGGAAVLTLTPETAALSLDVAIEGADAPESGETGTGEDEHDHGHSH